MAKKYDVLVKTGEYESNGQKKARYENVGVVMEKDGKPYMLLKRTFNPAGVGDGTRDTILLSLFEPKEDRTTAQTGGAAGVADEIPF